MPNSHARHADFDQVPKSFGEYVPDIGIFCHLRRYIAEIFHMSQQIYEVAENKISAGLSRIMRPAELNEIVQYYGFPEHRTPPLSWTVTGCHNCISNSVRLPVSDFLPIHTSTTVTMHNLYKSLVILLVAVKKY